MKKVYIVTAGQYSDYGICEVFSKKELAEEYIKRNERVGYFDEYDNAQVEEYPIDNNLPNYPKGLFHYEVSIGLRSGKIRYFNVTRSYDDKKLKYEVLDFPHEDEEILNVYCWSKNKEHAKKIAIDIRTRVLAERENLL
jgi:hypothetical protein